ncbi:SPOR domain-containing protein [Stappia sp. ES.058]|uniref:SPOR domain-containing protein n=1 Tax=Stappia sp. ES.058 TaxID=1881061 RepID=UPI00087A9721|nr:SPOR domain-containing protein [Stappia sp. ES.058]SDU10770.1 Sporulation related domain-containing protein [Stappia sp. ES.058]
MKPLEYSKKAPLRGRKLGDTGRISLWGGAALLFGVVGVSSVFLTPPGGHSPQRFSNTQLPPAGDVRTTASIGAGNDRPGLEIYPSAGGTGAAQARHQIKGEVETLRREVAALKRTVAVLQERKAILAEKLDDVQSVETRDPDQASAPVRQPTRFNAKLDAAVEAIAGKPGPVETMPAPVGRVTRRAPPKPAAPRFAEETLPANLSEPVRIVALPGAEPPANVASVPTAENTEPALPAVPGARPPTKPDDARLSISGAAGRISGAAGNRIGRSDFALDLGRFESREEAEGRWAEIRETQPALPATISSRIVDDPQNPGELRLMAGPFPNAADAAAACAYLSSGDITCLPALYPRDTAARR